MLTPSVLTDPPPPAAGNAVAVMTAPRRLRANLGDAGLDTALAEAAGVTPSVETANESASAAGDVAAGAALRLADATAGWLIVPAFLALAAGWDAGLCERARAFGPAFDVPAFEELADGPGLESVESAYATAAATVVPRPKMPAAATPTQSCLVLFIDPTRFPKTR
ncbi:hypothetical protein [Mycolicibacterium sp. P1-5]|uniref:hypothetical protein n=1 Tax=Mycolicibacterium sp. P1-5 TaxID=2024617 RepID=UPI00188317EA|nr:hypothetical protein [Mycolicibacterium sp. P1-5]